MRYTRALTIAGSDSGGGAGIQADLKTFSACGCFGMSVITAITAQNTCGVTAIHPVPPDIIKAQIRAVLEDIGCDAIKIGMLQSSEVIDCVADSLRHFPSGNIILDPVMVATSGDRLMKEEAVATLRDKLFPLARLITPNIHEAEILAGRSISSVDDMIEAAHFLRREHSLAVLLKGGHLQGGSMADVFCDRQGPEVLIENTRIDTTNNHGTGCTLSSAIAAFTAGGAALPEAIRKAEHYLHQALAAGAAYTLGRGHGPVHHFHAVWP